jgi:hypothetical protein
MAITERRRYRIDRKGVRSLSWVGDELVDWAAGLTGWGLPFDEAVTSPTREYAAAYTRLGTKGVILKGGKVLREVNRSFYCAEAYVYPITLARLVDGREVLIHCPDAYNRLEIDLLENGVRLTQRPSKGIDIFHSRLQTSPSGRYLMSAGWVWHPFGVIQVFDLEAALSHPETLDARGAFEMPIAGEVQSACWIDDDRLLVATDPTEERVDAPDFDPESLGQGELACWSISNGNFQFRTPLGRSAGPLMAAGDYVVTFFEHPRLIHAATGTTEMAWDDLNSGHQTSSIVWHRPPDPPLALDPARSRFAVADSDGITVVELG